MILKIRQGKFTRVLPVFIWIAAVAAVGVLFVNQAQRSELPGISYSYEQTINCKESGYIRYLPVALYQPVKQGDTLAIIKENSIARENYNDDLLHAKQATALAELERLKKDLGAAEESLELEKYTLNNQTAAMTMDLAIAVENARIAVLEIKANLEPDKLALKDLEIEIQIVKSLQEQGASEEYELEKTQTQYDILNSKIEENKKLLAAAQKALEKAELRKNQLTPDINSNKLLTNAKLAPIRQAVIVQESYIKELVEEFDTIVLTAPFDGIINEVNYKPGQAIMGGEPIMKLIKPTADHITAWIPQKDMSNFDLNTKVMVISKSINRVTFNSQISGVGASIELMPEVLWPNPSIPTYGRPVQIPILPSFECLHNEIVGIKKIYKIN